MSDVRTIRIETDDTSCTLRVMESFLGGLQLDRCLADSRDAVIPPDIDGVPIVEIAASAFARQEHVERIVCPPLAKAMANRAFSGCRSLTTLVLPRYIEHADVSWFAGCSVLDELVLPDEIEYVPTDFFTACQARTIVIGSKARRIDLPRKPLPHLEELHINDANENFRTDGRALFDAGGKTLLGCPTIVREYAVPDGCEEIAADAFKNNSQLECITLPPSVKHIGNRAFMASNLRRLEASEGLLSIGNSAFWRCKLLEHIDIPEGARFIGEGAFRQCLNLHTLYLPKTVEHIGWNAFAESGLTFSGAEASLHVDPSNPYYHIDNTGLLYKHTFSNQPCSAPENTNDGTQGETETRYILQEALDPALETCTVQANTEAIGAKAFFQHAAIRHVSLPKGLTCIEKAAFYGCAQLTKADMPESLVEICDEAFRCAPLEALYLPAGFMHYGDLAVCPLGDVGSNAADRKSSTFPRCAVTVNPRNERFYVESGLLCKRVSVEEATRTSAKTLDTPAQSSAARNLAAKTNRQVLSIEDARNETTYELELPTEYQTAPFEVFGTGSAYVPASVKNVSISDTPDGDIALLYVGGTSTVRIPERVTAIAPYAFADATDIDVLVIHEHVQMYGEESLAFAKPPRELRILQTDEMGATHKAVFRPTGGDASARAINTAINGRRLDCKLLANRLDDAAFASRNGFERAKYEIFRLQHPCYLTENNRAKMQSHLERRVIEIGCSFAKHAYYRGLEELIDLGIVSEGTLTKILDSLAGNGNVEAAAKILEIKISRFERADARYEL